MKGWGAVFSVLDIIGPDVPRIEILDIGAMPEGEYRYAPLLKLGVASITAFEPLPEERQKAMAAVEAMRCLPYALGDGTTADFHITSYRGCSSLLEPDPVIINQFGGMGTDPGTCNFGTVSTMKMKTHRLDDLDEVGAADYLKIDVQGAELLVLENGRRSLQSVHVAEIEVEFVPLYKNQPLFSEIELFMRGNGLIFHKFVDFAGRTIRPIELEQQEAVISQVLWADAIFVRNYTFIEQWTNNQLIKAAVILHEVYLSYDLVIKLLLELDRRNDTGWGEAYYGALCQNKMDRMVNTWKK
ncbi:MAG: FkbM family methyltransferase [Alphaproteobacteria bacterium]